MGFKIIVSPRAQKEIEEAIDYYSLQSESIPKNFIISLELAYITLIHHPYFGFRYKNVRALKIKKFPYLLYYVLMENRKTVRVLPCFHTNRNPNTKP